jgi:radical SAM superfamily enzyme YgiQ (UPF0313 family)
MKVLLINPPLQNAVKTFDSYFTMNAVNIFPPANLLSLGTVLRKKTNHAVRILDAYNDNLSFEEITAEVAKEKPDVVGVPAHTVTFYDCLHTIKAAKRACPEAISCVGGPLTKMFPKEILHHKEIDYVFLGDCEYTFCELVNTLEKKLEKKSKSDNTSEIDKIKGIMYRENGKIIETGSADKIKNLDELPFPDLTLIDYKKYYSAIGQSNSMAIIIGSRGCPYQCFFCSSANSGYRMRSIQSMLNEIKMYMDHGVTEFMFYDDTFNITPKRVIDFSKGVLERGYKIKWSFRGRIDLTNEEMFKVAKEAGLILMSYGVEDATDAGLEYMKRANTLKQVFEGTALAKKYKAPTSINFIIGLPQHKTKEDVYRVIKLAKKLQPTYCQFMLFQPNPGTTFYQMGIERGIVDPNFWLDYLKNPKKEMYALLWEESLSRQELQGLINKAHRNFYFDPFYMLKMLTTVKNMNDFIAKTRAGLNILRLFALKATEEKTPTYLRPVQDAN